MEIVQLISKKIIVYNKNEKILVSNGKSLVLKQFQLLSLSSENSKPILDKNFLINKIYSLEESIIDNSYIKYTIMENENKISFFRYYFT